VSTFSVGYDHVDVAAAADRGIAVGHTPGVLTETTADLAWALLLTCARRTVEGHAYVDADEWEVWGPTLLTGADVHDATLGIVGLGKIGTAVAERSAGFGMEVLYTGPTRKPDHEADLAEVGVDATFVDRGELLARSDVVSLHVPLTEDTAGYIGEDELRRMDDDAILLNTSRGGVVDTDALDAALDRGWIARAGLDVTDPEPLPADHPLLRHAPERLVVTPHIGSATVGTRGRMAEMAAANVEAGIEGRDLPHSALRDAGVE
jgi:glyoxylate reductase